MRWIDRFAVRPAGCVAVACQGDHVAAVRMTGGERPRLLDATVESLGESPARAIERLGRRFPRQSRALLLLNSRQYQLLQIDLPAVEADELLEAVRWQLRDRLDGPLDSYTVDLVEIPPDPAASFPRRAGYAAVVHNAELAPWQIHFAHSRLRLDTVDIPELAQHNHLQLAQPGGQAAALLSVLPQESLLTIGPVGQVCLSRRIEVGAAQLAQPDNISLYERIVLELQRSLDSFERQYASWPLERVWLARFGDQDSLLGHLIESLYLPVKPLRLEEWFDSADPTLKLDDPAVAEQYFMALGLGLRGLESP
ncbi:hypothetical protein [Chitinimonas lacunae]|uniref:Agglutinin biogenesis protein MshI n=1 Tax=Chitinimonas lacunae TaxID=1963018 RepID=A0ABV8MYA4_9NEIS